MQSALTIINKAFSFIGVKAAEVDLSNFEIDDAIDSLNDMMYVWDGRGIALGFTEIGASSDLVTVPDWSRAAIKTSLAGVLAAQYDRTLTPAMIATVGTYMQNLLERTQDVGTVAFTSTLPIGSGNDPFDNTYVPRYFGNDSENAILTGNGEALLDGEAEQLERDTVNE